MDSNWTLIWYYWLHRHIPGGHSLVLSSDILVLNLKWVFKFLTFHVVTMLHVRERCTNFDRTIDCFAERRQLLNKNGKRVIKHWAKTTLKPRHQSKPMFKKEHDSGIARLNLGVGIFSSFYERRGLGTRICRARGRDTGLRLTILCT